MTRMYGHKWTSSFGTDIDPGNVWSTVLRGLTKDDISNGFNKLVERTMEWPPSAPEFLNMCLSDNYMTLAMATAEFNNCMSRGVGNIDWSKEHPAMYWCYQQIGYWECRNATKREIEARFRELWPEALIIYRKGEMQAREEFCIEKQPEETEKPCSPEVSAEHLKSLKGIFNI